MEKTSDTMIKRFCLKASLSSRTPKPCYVCLKPIEQAPLQNMSQKEKHPEQRKNAGRGCAREPWEKREDCLQAPVLQSQMRAVKSSEAVTASVPLLVTLTAFTRAVCPTSRCRGSIMRAVPVGKLGSSHTLQAADPLTKASSSPVCVCSSKPVYVCNHSLG